MLPNVKIKQPACTKLTGDEPAFTAVGRTIGSCFVWADAGGLNFGILGRLST